MSLTEGFKTSILRYWLCRSFLSSTTAIDISPQKLIFSTKLLAYSVFCRVSSERHVISFGFRTRALMNNIFRIFGLNNLYLLCISLLSHRFSHAVATHHSFVMGFCKSVCTCIHIWPFLLYFIGYFFRLCSYELFSYGISYLFFYYIYFFLLFLYVQI